MSIMTSRPVVVGIDGSVASEGALAYGAWEAQRRGQVLRLVHSLSVPVPYATVGLFPDPTEFSFIKDAARTMLGDYAAKVRRAYPALEVETSVTAGSAGGSLVDASDRASLVVVGSRGLGGFTGLLLGSVGAQLAAHSRSPVVVIRPPGEPGHLGAGPPHAPVVVGIDGIPESEAALAFAFDQAAARGVGLRALYAWWMVPLSSLGPSGRRHYDLVEAEDEARRMLGEATAGWRQKYSDVDVELLPAHSMNPAVALLDASHDTGLLVVSRHGGNALTRLVLGSVGDIAVREADCPVAIVPEVPA